MLFTNKVNKVFPGYVPVAVILFAKPLLLLKVGIVVGLWSGNPLNVIPSIFNGALYSDKLFCCATGSLLFAPRFGGWFWYSNWNCMFNKISKAALTQKICWLVLPSGSCNVNLKQVCPEGTDEDVKVNLQGVATPLKSSFTNAKLAGRPAIHGPPAPPLEYSTVRVTWV